MRVAVSVKDGKMTIRASGELDHHAAGEAMKKIEEAIEFNTPRDCVLDIRDISFMDSSGVAVSLKAYRLMNAMGGRFWIENAQPQAMRVLDASGIDRLIKITTVA